MTIAIGYARQSLGRAGEDEDTSLSLDAQESAIRSYCAKQGWTVQQVIRDHDLKGDNPSRPGIAKLLDTVGPDTVAVVFALSRLARDNILQETIYRRIAAKGSRLVSVTEPHAEDALVRGIIGVINEQERVKMGRILAAQAEERFRRGKPHGLAPWGYTNEQGSLVVDETVRPAIELIFQMAADGESGIKIVRALNNQGYRTPGSNGPWVTTPLYRLIRNPTYAGGLWRRKEIRWPEEGDQWHEPIVSRELFERAQFEMARRHKHAPRQKPTPSPYEGLIVHECGHVSYLRSNGREWREGRYASFVCGTTSGAYPCDLLPRSISQEKLDRMVPALLMRDLRDLAHPDEVIDRAMVAFDKQTPDILDTRRELEGRLADLGGRVKRAELLWMEGLRSLDWFREHEASVQAEQQELRDALEALPSTPDPKELRQIARAITSISGHIDELPPDAVAALVRRLGVVQHGPSGVKMVYNSLAALLVPEPCVLPNRGRNDPRPSRSF